MPVSEEKTITETATAAPLEKTHALAELITQRGNWNNLGGDLAPQVLTFLPGFEHIRLCIYRDIDDINTNQPWHDSVFINPASVNATHTIRLLYSGDHYDTLLDTGQIIKIRPDGDCFFRSVLQALSRWISPEELTRCLLRT